MFNQKTIFIIQRALNNVFEELAFVSEFEVV
jgi:hypothetical protein